jgi:hypothetical protein
VTETVTPAGVFLRPELPDEALYGLPGDVVRKLAPTTEADPAAMLLTFMTMLGNVIGSEPHVEFGGASHPGRLFCLVVGDAASGRKGTSLAVIERLFDEAAPDWHDTRILRGLQSPEAMIERVQDGPKGDPRLLMVETEFQRLLVNIARTGGGFSAQLRRAWDGSVLELQTKKKAVAASTPHISMIAHITPQELLKKRGEVAQAGGLESRLLYAYVSASQKVSPFAKAPNTSDLIERIQLTVEASQIAVLRRADPISRELCLLRGTMPSCEFPVSLDAQEKWQELVEELHEGDRSLGSMFDRAQDQLVRLALLYALGDLADEIKVEHIRAALALWQYCAKSAEVILSIPYSRVPPKVNPDKVAKLFSFLKERFESGQDGGWVRRSEITADLFQRNTESDEIDAMLADLDAKAGLEHDGDRTTGGRPATMYRLRKKS